MEFFSGYLIEQALSVDNLFVFILLFDYFKVPKSQQSRVLAWGIWGAIGMRGAMILVGAAALKKVSHASSHTPQLPQPPNPSPRLASCSSFLRPSSFSRA